VEGHSAQFGSARLHCFVLKTGFIITAALCVLINGWMDSWSRCNILTRLLCDNNLVMTEIERLMNVSSYFSDNGNNSSWIDHFVCIVFCCCLFVVFPVFLLSFISYGPVVSEIKLEWMNRNLGFEQWLVYLITQRRTQNNNSEWHRFFYVLYTV